MGAVPFCCVKKRSFSPPGHACGFAMAINVTITSKKREDLQYSFEPQAETSQLAGWTFRAISAKAEPCQQQDEFSTDQIRKMPDF